MKAPTRTELLDMLEREDPDVLARLAAHLREIRDQDYAVVALAELVDEGAARARRTRLRLA